MYACAANEAERTAIHDVLFGTAMDAIDRYLPDKQKHAVLRSMLAFLAINSTYRGPYTPGSATCLAFALAVPDDTTAMMTKLEGGIPSPFTRKTSTSAARSAARTSTARCCFCCSAAEPIPRTSMSPFPSPRCR